MLLPPCKNSRGERALEVLLALQNIFFRERQPLGLVKEAIRKFNTARRLFGRGYPLVVREEIGVDECALFSVRFRYIMFSTMTPQQCLLEITCTFERIQLPAIT